MTKSVEKYRKMAKSIEKWRKVDLLILYCSKQSRPEARFFVSSELEPNF